MWRRSKPQTSWWCYRKIQGVTKVIGIHSLGAIFICNKFHSNLSNSCWDISVWINRQTDIAMHNIKQAGSATFPLTDKCVHTILLQQDTSKKKRAEQGQSLSTQLHSLDCTCICQYMKAEARWLLCIPKHGCHCHYDLPSNCTRLSLSARVL